MSAGAPRETQCASSVLMIRPARFGSNPVTAASNRFQFQDTGVPPAAIAAASPPLDPQLG